MKDRLPFSCLLALRQLRYMGRKLIGSFSGVCVAVLLVFVQIGFMNAMVGSVLNLPNALRADILIAGQQFETLMYSPPWVSRPILQKARTVDGVKDIRSFYANIAQVRSPIDGTSMTARFIAFDPSAPVMDQPRIEAGLPLITLPRAALLDSRSRRRFLPIIDSLHLAREERLYFQLPSYTLAPELRVIGLFDLGPDFSIDGSILMSALNFERYFSFGLDRISLGIVTASPGQDVIELRERLSIALGKDARVYTKTEFLASERNYLLLQTPMGVVLGFGLLIGTFIGSVFVLQVLHGIIEVNISEYAVLRAMGYSTIFFSGLVLQIAVVIGAGAFVPSVLITLLIYGLMERTTGLVFSLSLSNGLIVLISALVMSCVAALFAIQKLRRTDPLNLFA